ncbi:hypothetical protein [Pseudoalteromonas sp. BDTF-M6]|uniref:hypothetical protein n=1 Tax=Pseudoalteromonas sp. BDTF-M6 TaxID=2796132 RepID=UPI001BB07C09|nr:hypothetical protein [Pseudoalteromonas sp. BDTF-M6]MBS3798896.1 hypothetical protein [Pseudoalteromonas sp. BDTF-M6]
MEFTDQEVAFFQQLFSEKPLDNDNLGGAGLSLRSTLPDYVAPLFDNPGLYMLAEVGHFELWFPLSLNLTENNDIQPQLGAPEIFEAQGIHRSWRFDNPSDITLKDQKGQLWPVRSLSSTGAVIDITSLENPPQSAIAKLILPQYDALPIKLKKTRQQDNFVAVTFVANENKRQLRQYLFEQHKRHFQHIYQSLTNAC